MAKLKFRLPAYIVWFPPRLYGQFFLLSSVWSPCNNNDNNNNIIITAGVKINFRS